MRIVNVELVPFDPCHITPLELLEDFADCRAGWCFLEEDSRYYAALRGQDACVVRHAAHGAAPSADLAFATRNESSRLYLAVVLATDGQLALDLAQQKAIIEHFARSFEPFARRHGVRLELEEQTLRLQAA